MTQVALAGVCGVSKWAQINFEKDENVPGGSYLLLASDAGVDIGYVLVGVRSIFAIHLDEGAFAAVRKSRNSITQLRVALGTNMSADLGLGLTDEMMVRAREMQADIVELTLKVHQTKDAARSLSNIWRTIEGLVNARNSRNADVRSLKVEMFDGVTGEFTARDLIRERSHVELDTPVGVQQMPSRLAFDLLMEAHKRLVMS